MDKTYVLEKFVEEQEKHREHAVLPSINAMVAEVIQVRSPLLGRP